MVGTEQAAFEVLQGITFRTGAQRRVLPVSAELRVMTMRATVDQDPGRSCRGGRAEAQVLNPGKHRHI